MIGLVNKEAKETMMRLEIVMNRTVKILTSLLVFVSFFHSNNFGQAPRGVVLKLSSGLSVRRIFTDS
jgi:hypothetical protein